VFQSLIGTRAEAVHLVRELAHRSIVLDEFQRFEPLVDLFVSVGIGARVSGRLEEFLHRVGLTVGQDLPKGIDLVRRSLDVGLQSLKELLLVLFHGHGRDLDLDAVRLDELEALVGQSQLTLVLAHVVQFLGELFHRVAIPVAVGTSITRLEQNFFFFHCEHPNLMHGIEIRANDFDCITFAAAAALGADGTLAFCGHARLFRWGY